MINIYEDIIKNATGSVVPAVTIKETKPMSFRDMYRGGVAYRAIKEAADGERACKAKSARVSKLIAVIYLLQSEAMQLADEMEHMVNKEMRSKCDLKTAIRKMELGFDDMYRAVRPMITPGEMEQFRNDFELFDVNVRSWAGLEGYVRKTDEEELEFSKRRAVNLHLEFLDKINDIKNKFGEEKMREVMDWVYDETDNIMKREDGNKKD